MRKIKVLHLTSSPSGGVGGVERLLLDLASHYDRSHFDVWHCNLFDRTAGTGAFPNALKATELPYFEIEGSRWHGLPKILRKLLRLIKSEEFDVVHLHMLHATIIGGVMACFARSPAIVVTKHYTYDVLDSAVFRVLDRVFTNRADRIAAVSKVVEADILKHGANRSSTTTIYNGLDLATFDPRSCEHVDQLASGENSVLIGCVGNLNTIKGHEYFVRAMPEILRSFPPARFVLIGEGAERSHLEQLSRSLGVADAVILTGFRENVPALLAQIDLYVQPSLRESFGIAILEAMAASKCVVASDVDGIPEVVLDGVTGLLVPPADVDAIARAVCSLLGDAARRDGMGIAGRARVEQEFDIKATAGAYQQLYLKLAPSKKQSRRT